MLPAAEVGEWVPLLNCRCLPKAGGLYVLRCTVNGKLYVGKSMDIQRRAYKHCRPEHLNAVVSRAVLSHGAAAFEIMIWCLSEDEPALLRAEMALIITLSSKAPRGYNLTDGGEGSSGYRHTPEVIARIAAANTGKKRPAAACAATKLANTGKKRSPEVVAEMSRTRKGVPQHSVERRARMSVAMKGRVLGPGVQEKMIASLRTSAAVKANVMAIGIRRQRPVLVWLPDSLVPLEFESIKAVNEWGGFEKGVVSNYCRGCEARSGYRFAYLE